MMKKRNKMISLVIVVTLICQMLLVQSIMGKDIKSVAISRNGSEYNLVGDFYTSETLGYLNSGGDYVPWTTYTMAVSGSTNSLGTKVGYAPETSKAAGKTTSKYFIIDVTKYADIIDDYQLKFKAMVDMGNNCSSLGLNKDTTRLRISFLDENRNKTGNTYSEDRHVYYKDWANNVTEQGTVSANTRYIKYEIETIDQDALFWASGNFAMFANPRLYLYDTKGPFVKEVTVETKGGDDWHYNNYDNYFVPVNDAGNPMYKAGDEILFNIEFIEPVTVSGLKLNYYFRDSGFTAYPDEAAFNWGFTPSRLNDGKSYIVSGKVPNNVKDGMILKVTSIEATYVKDASNLLLQYNTASLAPGVTAIIDEKHPVMQSISCINGNYSHKLGENEIIFTLKFDEKVKTQADAYFVLNNGGHALYLDGTGTDTLRYKYTVNKSDRNIAKLEVHDTVHVINDLVGNYCPSTIPANMDEFEPLPDQTFVVAVDTEAPTVSIANQDGTAYEDESVYKNNHDVYIVAADKDNVTLPQDINISYYWDIDTTVDAQASWTQISNGTAPVPNPTDAGKANEPEAYYLQIKAVDGAGNGEDHSVVRDPNVSPICEGPFYFDNEKPVITLNPNGGVNQPQYDVYIEGEDEKSGIDRVEYTWYKKIAGGNDVLVSSGFLEDANGDFTSSGTITSPEMNGEYYFVVKATDKAGNISDSLESNSYTVDTSYPVVDFAPEGNDSGEKNLSVDVTVRDSSSIKASHYQWRNSVTKPDVNDGNWIEFFTEDIMNPVDTHTETINSGDDKNGIWYLHIKAEDSSGNVGRYTSSKGFKLDNEAPNLVFSPNGNVNPQKAFETELRLDNEDFGYTVKYAITTSDVNTYNDGELEDYILTGDQVIFNLDSQTDSEETDTYYIHVKVTDDAGNMSTLTSNPVYIDNTAPTGSALFNRTHTKNTTEQLSLTASDRYPAGSSENILMRISLDGGISWANDWMAFSQGKDITFNEEKAYDIAVQYKDEAGNESDIYHANIIYDQTIPQIDSFIYDNSWTNQDLPVTVKFIDAIPSEDMVIQVINDQTTAEVTVLNNVITFKENGTCAFKYIDLAGNENTDTITISNMDLEGPEIAISPDGDHVKKMLVHADISAADNISSNQDLELSYSWSQSHDVQPVDWTISHDGVVIKNSGTGKWYLWVKAVDEVGNETVRTSQSFELDNQKPIVTNVTYSPAVTTANNVVAKIDFDENVKIKVPEITDTYTTSYEYTFVDNGSMDIIFVDEVGNESSHTLTIDWIDRSKPSATNTYDPNTWTNGAVALTVTADDLQNGLYDVIPMINGQRVMIKTGSNDNAVAECAHHWNNDTGVVQLTGNVYDQVADGGVTLTAVSVNGDGCVTEAKFLLEENGTIDYKIKRLDTGVSGDGQAVVDKIDEVGPGAAFTYTSKGQIWHNTHNGIWTNEDIIVTIEPRDNSGQPVTIVNNDGSNQYVFTDNEVIDFILQDAAGNITTTTAAAITIDREDPTGTLSYTSGTKSWQNIADELWTNQDVIVTLNAVDNSGEPVEILNNEGSNIYVFTENGSFTFDIKDAAGNEKEITARVTKIDKEVPNPVIAYSTQEWTKEDVTVSITFNNESEAVTILNNGGKNTYTFTENGSFTFEYTDAAGNKGEKQVTIKNIDKAVPEVEEVWYSTTEPTNTMVGVKLYINEIVSFITDGGEDSYTFEDNGSHEFIFKDRAGNQNSYTVTVTNIDRTEPKVWIEYSTTELTNEDVIATLKGDEELLIINNYNRDQYTFKENGSFEFIYTDLAGNGGEITATVDNIDTSLPDVTLTYSETELTQNDVVVTISSNIPITPVNYTGDTVTFTDNGVRWLKALDQFGDEFYFKAEVANIDRVAPTITFTEGDNIVVPLNSEFDPLKDVSITDNLDEAISSQLEVEHNVDTSQLGEYQVTYSATDSAGNGITVNRQAMVVDTNSFTAYVNKSVVTTGEAVIRADYVSLDVFGVKGDYTIKWHKGKVGKGAFKGCEDYVENGYLEVNRSGYISFLIQDQERNTKIIHVYIIYTEQ